MKVRPRTVAAALAGLLVLTLAGGARGFDGPSCGGAWTSSKTCTLAYSGQPIALYGDAEATSGTVNVRVWLSPAGSPEIALMECKSSGQRFTDCSQDTPDDGLRNLPQQLRQVALQCNVSGRPGGIYGCASGHRE